MINNIKCKITMDGIKQKAYDKFIERNIILPMARNWSTDQLNEMMQREENPNRKEYYRMALIEQTKQLIASCK